MSYSIALARAADVAALPDIEGAAAALMVGHLPGAVLAERTPLATLAEAQRAGRLWVARADDTPVGFALLVMLAPDRPHLAEMDVAPAHGRRGLGAGLLRAVIAWATGAGHAELTLTTARAVPWNMPFYARFGFEEIPPHALDAALAAVVADETTRGLAPHTRVVMRYRTARRPS